jgi:hypothetical protein
MLERRRLTLLAVGGFDIASRDSSATSVADRFEVRSFRHLLPDERGRERQKWSLKSKSMDSKCSSLGSGISEYPALKATSLTSLHSARERPLKGRNDIRTIWSIEARLEGITIDKNI